MNSLGYEYVTGIQRAEPLCLSLYWTAAGRRIRCIPAASIAPPWTSARPQLLSNESQDHQSKRHCSSRPGTGFSTADPRTACRPV